MRAAVIGLGSRAEMWLCCLAKWDALAAFRGPSVRRMGALHHQWPAESGSLARYVTAALPADREVVVGKSVTGTYSDLRGTARAAFNCRYTIGTVDSVHFERWWYAHRNANFRHWRWSKAKSGGLLIRKSPHHIDLILWRLGAETDGARPDAAGGEPEPGAYRVGGRDAAPKLVRRRSGRPTRPHSRADGRGHDTVTGRAADGSLAGHRTVDAAGHHARVLGVDFVPAGRLIMATPMLIAPTPEGRREHRTRLGRRRGKQRAAYAFLLPWSVGAAVLTVGPMVISLYLSFTNYDLFDTPRWIGAANYVQMFTADDHYWHAVIVTLTYVAISVPMKLVVALAVALLLNRTTRGSGFYRSAFYAPSLLGASVAVALVWRGMFGAGGTVQRVFGVLGIHVGSMTDQPQYALLTLIALGVWQFGAPMVIFLAGLKQVPSDLYEAAAIDGAGPVRRFFSVTVPALSPVLLFNLVLETIQAFQAFTSAFVISSGRGGPSDSTLLYTLYLYQRGFNDFRMGYASAMAWVLLVVIALITMLLFRSANRWVFYAGEAK